MTAPVPPASPTFRDLYGRDPEVAASSPGRVNLIGEHTDYNGGFVLPTVIPQRTTVELARREDRLVRVWSDAIAATPVMQYELGHERRTGSWVDYVQGITWALADEGFLTSGVDMRISSTVPVGSGLSSSAAIEMSVVKALTEAFALPIDPLTMARVGRRAENDLVGAPTGVMDQMASLLADDGHALFIDTRTMRYEAIPLPPGVELMVIDSTVRHELSKGDYRTRRAECEEASRLLGIRELRDIGTSDLARLDSLPDPLNRRARHVVTENQRVLDAVVAMRAGDVASLGRLFAASHNSMRDDYEVSVSRVDLLVELALEDPVVVGARLTGGGFGGSIVALVGAGHARKTASRVAAGCLARTGTPASVLVPSDI